MDGIELKEIFNNNGVLNTSKPLYNIMNSAQKQKYNYNYIKTYWDTYYKITNTVEKKLYSICQNFNKDNVKTEVLDIELFDKFVRFSLRAKYSNPFIFKDMSNEQIMLLLMMQTYPLIFNIRPVSNYLIIPIVIKHKYIIFVEFDEDNIHDIVVITAENTVVPNTKIFIEQLNWRSLIHPSEFNIQRN